MNRSLCLRGFGSRLLLVTWAAMAALTGPAMAGSGPAWWVTRAVVDTNATASDYRPANQGQAKWLATNAFLEFLDKVPGATTNVALSNAVSGFTLSGNYLPLNEGQIKALAKTFYDCLTNAALTYPYLTNALPLGMVGSYPWTLATNDDSNYSPANLGQLKYAFSFDFDRDSDADGAPDFMDIDPNNPSVGQLTVTIEKPSAGTTLY